MRLSWRSLAREDVDQRGHISREAAHARSSSNCSRIGPSGQRIDAYTVFGYLLKDGWRHSVVRRRADVYYGRETKAARRLPKTLWPVIWRKLDALNRARTLQDLRLPAGNRLEPLKGDQAGRFRFVRTDRGQAQEVVCEDYH